MRWIGLALLGIVVAAAVSIAASRLASQQIGLASQPISAGDALAPRVTGRAKRRAPSHHRAEPKTNPAPSTPPTTSEPPVDTTPSAPSAPPEAEPSYPGGHEGEHGDGGADD